MSAQVWDGSAWKTVDRAWVHDGSSWREIQTAWVYDGSEWKEFFTIGVQDFSATDASVCDGVPDYQALLEWTPHDTFETHIYRDGAKEAEIAPSVGSYLDSDIALTAQLYTYEAWYYDQISSLTTVGSRGVDSVTLSNPCP